MAKKVEVTAARAHKSGYARRPVKTGESYSVPEAVVGSLVRQKLIKDPAKSKDAKASEDSGTKSSSGKKNG